MERKIENVAWKMNRLKQLRKRCLLSISFNTVIVFVFTALSYFLNNVLYVYVGLVLLCLAVFLSIRSAKASQNYAQETMIYKLSDESFQDEWNDYVTTIDYTLSKQYDAYIKKHSKE